ncbi:MAG: sigma 54-interacting transcriptional regulator [Myxococcota bacterium]
MDVPELIVSRADRDLVRVKLDPAETPIGRHPSCPVAIPDKHLPDIAMTVLNLGGERFKLRDYSGLGIVLNGKKVTEDEVDLAIGDTFTLAGYEVRLHLRPDEPSGGTAVMTVDRPAELPGATLRVQDQVFRLPLQKPFNIGSDPNNDWRPSDPFISSFHCRFQRIEGRWTLIDLSSTNGSFINGLRVGQTELPPRATVRVGQTEMEFEVEKPAAKVETSELGDDVVAYAGMIARSPAMLRVFELVKKLADAPSPVLIIGPTGSGKELVARAVHDASKRKRGPYVAINCGALANNLIESELFGHEKGSFTGALADKKGAFEAAQGGTIFLDEIGEMPLELQPKMLRALEASAVRRVGATRELPIDARVIAATHRNLKEAVDDGIFREDLFHRLYVLSISVPALAQRREDIVPLARHFIQLHATAERRLTLAPITESALEQHDWPGNVRELRNVMLRAVLTAEDDVILPSHLDLGGDPFDPANDIRKRLRESEEAERKRFIEVIEEVRGNRAEAARKLGLSKSTFHDRLKRLGIPLKFRR